ncbi:MAG: hypothetical protein DDT34_01347 [Firmicutes bacterium]|nr:hypothetical protein [candidate division NPL-UPA2 bacterium]MBT9136273.1 hypothetical protein [Bacillota bacterium]
MHEREANFERAKRDVGLFSAIIALRNGEATERKFLTFVRCFHQYDLPPLNLMFV